MEEYNKTRGNDCRNRVLSTIEKCKLDGNISVKRVCELADVNRSYFTNHPEMRQTLDTAIGIVNRKIKKRKQNQDSKEVLLKSMYTENDILKNYKYF